MQQIHACRVSGNIWQHLSLLMPVHFLRYPCIKQPRPLGLPKSALARTFTDTSGSFLIWGLASLASLFFNSSGDEITRMGAFVSRVWSECGLPGSPTLTDIRTAISTHVCLYVCMYINKLIKTFSISIKLFFLPLTFEDRQKVSQAMAHDITTAGSFTYLRPLPNKPEESDLTFWAL